MKLPLAVVGDALRYIATWSTTGAVAPSGRRLAARMVQDIDPAGAAPILELGPGNGVVTEALIERGVSPDRIVAVEYNSEFCALLAARFPGVRVIEGDAFDLGVTLGPLAATRFAAAVSSLPLLLRPPPDRHALVLDVLARLLPGGRLTQFSYSPKPPVPASPEEFLLTGSPFVLLNLPPARVWTYSALS